MSARPAIRSPEASTEAAARSNESSLSPTIRIGGRALVAWP